MGALARATLDAADAVLVGLSSVFPGVEAVREFKDALEAAIAMRRDLE